jgi:Fe-S-cluster-containing dehydrogenase component
MRYCTLCWWTCYYNIRTIHYVNERVIIIYVTIHYVNERVIIICATVQSVNERVIIRYVTRHSVNERVISLTVQKKNNALNSSMFYWANNTLTTSLSLCAFSGIWKCSPTVWIYFCSEYGSKSTADRKVTISQAINKI